MSLSDPTYPAFDDRHNNAASGHNPAHKGCSSCGSQQTETLDSIHGRRCADCPPKFDPALAVELMRTDLGAAADYIRGSGGLGGAA